MISKPDDYRPFGPTRSHHFDSLNSLADISGWPSTTSPEQVSLARRTGLADRGATSLSPFLKLNHQDFELKSTVGVVLLF